MLHFGKIPKKFGENLARFNKKFSKILAKFAKILKKSAKISAIFNEKIEIRERCKGVHCVDLGESFPTNIYLQNLASIQPRTSPTKTIPDTPIPTPPPPLKPALAAYVRDVASLPATANRYPGISAAKAASRVAKTCDPCPS